MSLLRRGAARTAALFLSLCAATALAFSGAAPASAGPGQGRGGEHAMGWYLALGDSLAAGYQPGQGDDRKGGYVGDVLGAVRAEAGKTMLRNLSCTGETSVSMGQGGTCRYPRGSQLDQAVQFLHAHARHTQLVTVTIGANDVQRCIDAATRTVDLACAQQGLVDVAHNLPVVLSRLRAAAPHTQIVVTNYDNPLLAAWVLLPGPQGELLAHLSTTVLDQLNATVAAGAAAVGAQVADVSTAFSSHDFDPSHYVTVPGFGSVPLSVARTCQWTWMCTVPQGPDTHPNDAGYAVIGSTVAATVDEGALVPGRRLAPVG
ncbi:MAG TPA: SGNH/GDSL hydrolase family protein [Segeticoccus sp.]|nr:SGNH/GDSL hydrolase family protein [Segeticoccus sp.]